MKKNKLYYIFILLLLGSNIVIYGQDDRNTLWGHGIERTNQAWTLYATHFESTRKLSSANTSYNSTGGIISSAQDYRTNYVQLLGLLEATEDRNIGIGHDVGGIIDRELDHTLLPSEQLHGGFITIGSPHAGMRFANSYVQGKVQDFTNDGCDKLTDGVVADIGPIDGFASTDICNLAMDYADSHYNNLTTLDIQEFSPYMMNLSQQGQTATPKANIYGIENSPVHWRLFSGIETPPFQLALDEQDESLVSTATRFRNEYDRLHGFSNRNVILGIVGAVLSFISPTSTTVNGQVAPGPVAGVLFGIGAIIAGGQAGKYKRAREWFDNSEAKWNELIGAVGTYTYTYTTEEYTCADATNTTMDGEYWVDILPPNFQFQDCWATVTHTTDFSVNQKSDGLLREGAAYYADAPPECNFMAEGANHEQLVNHPNVKNRLNTIFDGNVCNSFFETLPK